MKIIYKNWSCIVPIFFVQKFLHLCVAAQLRWLVLWSVWDVLIHLVDRWRLCRPGVTYHDPLGLLVKVLNFDIILQCHWSTQYSVQYTTVYLMFKQVSTWNRTLNKSKSVEVIECAFIKKQAPTFHTTVCNLSGIAVKIDGPNLAYLTTLAHDT